MYRCTQNSNRWALGMGVTSAGLQPKSPKCGLGAFGPWTWLVGLQSAGQFRGPWEQAEEVWSSWLCPISHRAEAIRCGRTRYPCPHPGERQPKQYVLRCKSRLPKWVGQMWKEMLFYIRKPNKIYSLLQISFAFLYLLLWHKCPLHLFTLTWGLKPAYFICPDGLHHFVKDDLSALERYVCQVPCMLWLIYCLPGGMLSPTGV